MVQLAIIDLFLSVCYYFLYVFELYFAWSLRAQDTCGDNMGTGRWSPTKQLKDLIDGSEIIYRIEERRNRLHNIKKR